MKNSKINLNSSKLQKLSSLKLKNVKGGNNGGGSQPPPIEDGLDSGN